RIVEHAENGGLMRLDRRDHHRPTKVRKLISDNDEVETSRALIEPIASVDCRLDLPVLILDEGAELLDHLLIALDEEDARSEVHHRCDRNFIVDLSCEREHRVECVVQDGSHLDEEIGAASTKSIARAGGGDRLLQVIHLIARFHYHVDAAEPESVDGCFESAPAE